MPATLRSRPTRPIVAIVVPLVLALGLAGCSSDESSSSTTAASDGSTTSTTTTLPDELPTVAELWTAPLDDSGSGVDAKVYATIQGGASADELTGVSVDTDLAASASLTPGSSVELPATTTVNLVEDSTYIELTDVAAPLEVNRAFYVTFEFQNAPDQRIEGVIRDQSDLEG